MMNLVEKYTTDEVAANEEGVVSIEYVIVAGAIVVALGGIWSQFGTQLTEKLDDIVGNVKDGGTG
jgi:Flp pilus assembly pilin Flp